MLRGKIKRIREIMAAETYERKLVFKATILTLTFEIATVIVAVFFSTWLEKMMLILIAMMIVHMAINSYVIIIHDVELQLFNERKREG